MLQIAFKYIFVLFLSVLDEISPFHALEYEILAYFSPFRPFFSIPPDCSSPVTEGRRGREEKK